MGKSILEAEIMNFGKPRFAPLLQVERANVALACSRSSGI